METTKLLLTLTIEQKEKITDRAAAMGFLSVADYLRSLINDDLGITADGIKWGGLRSSDQKGG